MGIRTRIVNVAGILPLRRAANAEIPVAGRSQRLAQPLILGHKTVVDEHELVRRIPVLAHRTHRPSRVQKQLHLSRVAKDVPGTRRSPGQLRVIQVRHENPDPSSAQRRECVLVGDVIADVQRQHVIAAQVQSHEQVQHGLALVPVDPRLNLVDHLPRRHLQRIGLRREHLIDDRLDPRTLALFHEPVMNRY